jgi:hypothetical protein
MAIQRKSYVWQGTSSAKLANAVWPNAVVGPQNLKPAILIQYDDTITDVADLDSYMISIGFIVGDGKVAYDPAVTPTDAPSGSRIVDAAGRWYRKRDDGSTNNVDLISDPTELLEIMPQPEIPTAGSGSCVSDVTLIGASFLVQTRTLINQIVFRVTAQGGAVGVTKGRFLLYQAPGGLSRSAANVASLIAKATTIAIDATGTIVTPLDAGASAFVEKGLLYVLWGRESAGTFSLRAYTTSSMDLLTTVVDADTHPLVFTTGITTVGAPAATFDPRNSPPGAAIAAAAINGAVILRLKKV